MPPVTAYVPGTRQVASVTDAAGHATSYSYVPGGSPGAGQVAVTTRPDGTTLRLEYDLEGRVVRRWGSAGYPQAFGYDAYGKMVSLTTWRDTGSADLDAAAWPLDGIAGDTTAWTYEEATGLLLAKQHPDGQGPVYTYDATGNLLTRTWARGVVTTYGYDGFNRRTSTSYSNDPANTPDVQIDYDRLGRPASIIQGSGANANLIAYSYDPATLLLDEEVVSYADGSLVRSIDRSYDAQLRPAGYDLLNGASTEQSVSYGYDGQGRLASVTSGAGTFGYSYHAANRDLLAGVSGPVHGVNLTYETNRDHLAQRANQLNGAGPLVSAYAYSVDSVGRRSDVTQTGSAFAVSGQTVDWSYNGRDEVVGADHSDDSSQDRGYAYDPIGNRLSATDDSGTTGYSANQLNQYDAVGGVAPVYDLDGNATEYPLPVNPGSNADLVWDAENRLIQVTTGGTVIDYAYDALSRRIRTTVQGGGDTWHVYEDWNEIATYDASGATLSLATTNTWGMDMSGSLQGAGGVGGLLAVTEAASGDSFCPTYDGNGNVSEYLDGSGAIVAHYEYDPFGKTTVASGPLSGQFRYRFSTKPVDAETGLYYYGYRWYDAGTGRWLSRDLIEEQGGLNLYGFALNNSLGWIDVLGASPHPEWSPPSSGPVCYDCHPSDNSIPPSPADLHGKPPSPDLDDIQNALDVGGLVPGIGEICDGINAAISAARGDFGDAALSIGAMAPGPAGWGATAAKHGGKAAKKIPRKSSKTIRNEWEKKHGKPWPKDPATGKNQDVCHKKPLADGGTNDIDNIEPLPHSEHVQQHKDSGDFKRWGERSKK